MRSARATSARPAGRRRHRRRIDAIDLRGRPSGDQNGEVDEVIGDDRKANPAFHAVVATIAAALEAMPTLADADASLASGTPSLSVAEPTLLLLTLAADTLAAVVGDADPLDTSGLCHGLVLARVEPSVSGDQARHAPQLCRVHIDRGDQQIRVMRPLGIDFIIDDDLVLRLLQLHQLAKFGRLGRLALADYLGRWLEDADDLA